jgi:hypothetical protein
MDLLNESNIAKNNIEIISSEILDMELLVKNIEESYDQKIRALQEEKFTRVSAAKKVQDRKLSVLNLKKEQNNAILRRVQHLLKIMNIIKGNPSVKIPKVYYYTDRDELGNYTSNKRMIYRHPIKMLRRDQYSIFNLYIVSNGKPKNKYSLIIRGYTIFGDLVGRNSWGYLPGINESHCNFYITVKDAPTEKFLVSYAEKNLSKIKNMIPDSIDDLIRDYKEAEELLKDIRWQIKYLEYKKDYYKNYYHNGTETKEYKEIIKQLNELTTKEVYSWHQLSNQQHGLSQLSSNPEM